MIPPEIELKPAKPPGVLSFVWTGRIGFALGILLFAVSAIFVFTDNVVVSEVRGETTVFRTRPLILPMMVCGFGIIFASVGILLWLTERLQRRIMAIVLFLVSLVTFFNAPTGSNHCFVVAPDHLFDRRGAWFAPVETKIEFKAFNLMILFVTGSEHGRNNFELCCFPKVDGEATRFAINDLSRKALPLILKQASESGLEVIDNSLLEESHR